MPSRSPLRPIFDPGVSYGSINFGAMIGTTTIQATASASVVTAIAASIVPTVETPFSPSDVAGTIFVWYDAADTATITLSGSNATAMNDKGPGAFHLQNGASAGPLSGTRTQNGLNVLDFQNATPGSGTGAQWLETVNSAGFFPVNSATYTMFVVFAHDNPAATNYSAVAVFGTGAEHGIRVLTTAARESYVTSGGGAVATGVAPGAGVWKQSAIEVGSSSGQPLTYRESGAAVSSTTLTGSPDAGTRFNLGVRTGGGRDFDGAIAEVLFYSPQLGSTDRGLVETYLASKWAV